LCDLQSPGTVRSLVRPPEVSLSAVRSVAFAPGEPVLVWGDDVGTVTVWDLTRGRPRTHLEGHLRAVRSVRFSPDGRRLASGSEDGTVRLWDAGQWKLLATFPLGGGAENDDAVNSVGFSRDGKVLAVGTKGRRVRLWDVETQKEKDYSFVLRGEVFAVAFSPGRDLLVAGGKDAQNSAEIDQQTVHWWDRPGPQKEPTPSWHGGTVWTMAFSPDGKRLATGSDTGVVKVWHPGTYLDVLNLPGGADPIFALAFSRDGRVLAAGDAGGVVRLWRGR
jgi:WD40 repeat protein